MSVLIINHDAVYYKSALERSIAGVEIHAVESKQQVTPAMFSANALFAFGTAIDDSLIDRLPALRWLQFLSTGTDVLARLPSLSPQAYVTSCHGVHGQPVSEMVFLHMLVLAREYRQIYRNQENALWEKRSQRLLAGKTVAIVGLGLIAEALARRCKAFEMTVLGVTRTPRELANFDMVYDNARLAEPAALADFLVVLAPLTERTRNLIDARIFGVMKPSAYLINVARGGVVDEAALLNVLDAGLIAGAGLDVFVREPLPSNHPFWRHERVMITSHSAGNNDWYPDLILPILENNLRCFLSDRSDEMLNIVAR